MRLTWVLLVAALLAVDVDARKKSGGGHRKEEVRAGVEIFHLFLGETSETTE